MDFLKKWDLKGKFIIITLIVSVTGLTIVSAALIGLEFANYRHSTADKLSVLSQIIGSNVTAAILFADPATASETLSALRAEQGILMARVVDRDKKVFASFDRDAEDAGRWTSVGVERMNGLLEGASSRTDEAWLHKGGFSSVLQPITMRGDHIGWVYVMADNSELVTRLKWLLAATVAVLLIVLIPIYFLSVGLKDVFLGPIHRLAEAMERVSLDKDFSLRVHRETRDELGDLVDGFNNMLLEIRRRDEELRKYGQELENKVKLRTTELEGSKLALEMTVEELRMAKERAEAASVAKSNFLASMSHELRTPLNAVIGFSEVLMDGHFGPLNEQQKDYLGDILASGQHLLALISDILDIAKIEAGRDELSLSVVNISEVVNHSLVMVRERTHKHSIALRIEIEPGVKEAEISADHRKLKQVMFNLLSNAAKFTPDGGKIDVAVGRSNGQIVVSVTDTGCGIPEGELEKIFEEFYQVRGGLVSKTPGTGLGLTLARKYVEMHGGRIWAQSKGPGSGSRFTFTLRTDLSNGAGTDPEWERDR